MLNNLRNSRLPARLDDLKVAHKTGSLEGVVNDVGILVGDSVDMAIAVFTDYETDSARTSLEIADLAMKVWQIVASTPLAG